MSSIEAQAPVALLVASLADNKYFLGRRYAEWCTAAPSLESAVAAASMAQDEIGHARSLYPLLRDIAGASPEVEPETRTQFCNVSFLDRPFDSWLDFVAANFLFDTALTTLLAAAEDSSMKGLAQRAKRIGQEERLHWLHAEGWVRRLTRNGDALKRQLQASFEEVGPTSVAWFQIAAPSLRADGILSADCDQLQDRYRAIVNPLLREASLQSI